MHSGNLMNRMSDPCGAHTDPMITFGTTKRPGTRRAWPLIALLLLATMSTPSVARSDRLPSPDDPASSISVLTKWSARVREIETELSHTFNQSTKLTFGWVGSREDSAEQGEPTALSTCGQAEKPVPLVVQM